MKIKNRINEDGRFANAIRGWKYNSGQLNQMDIDNQTYKANQGKSQQIKNKMYGTINNDLYKAHKGFENIILDNIFWGDNTIGNQLKKLQMLQQQIEKLYSDLRNLRPFQIREGISGAWWGFRNKDKDIEGMERNQKYVNRHFDSIDATNDEIDKGLRLIDIMLNLLHQFINIYSNYAGEEAKKHHWYGLGLQAAHDFYEELNKTKYQFNALKNEIGEKYWTRDRGNNNVREHKMGNKRTIRLTESKLRNLIRESIRQIIRENEGC